MPEYIIDECPYCGTRHVFMGVLAEVTTSNLTETWWRILLCKNPKCEKPVLAKYSTENKVVALYPAGSHELSAEATISQEIREDYREAGTCLDAGCFKASMVMGRRALQRVLKEQGCDQRTLKGQIDHAVDKSFLRKAFHDMAIEIREYGNLGAHPDDDQLQNCTKENALVLLQYVGLLVHEFYEVPATVAALKIKRTQASPET